MNCPKCGREMVYDRGTYICKCGRYCDQNGNKINLDERTRIIRIYDREHPQPSQPQTPPPPVTCPKCGSTQIQLVNKKWSLMTGFLTNKVDRVCVNCKTKF